MDALRRLLTRLLWTFEASVFNVKGTFYLRDNKLHHLTERDSTFAQYFALFWGLGLRLGYLATSGAKSDIIFLLGDPDFLQGGEISRVSRVVSEI